MSNEKTFSTGSDGNNYFTNGPATGDGIGYYMVGDVTTTDTNMAIRFPNVVCAESIQEAQLYLYVDSNGDDGEDVRLRIYGIDEDNTSNFSGGSPLGRSKTSASHTWDLTVPGTGQYINKNITDAVREVIDRGGWTSGNAIGLIIEEVGTSSDNAWFSGGPDNSSYNGFNSALLIRENAIPNFTPTPKSISAPSFPASHGHGLKIARPGIDVRSAPESDLWFTTDKKFWRILSKSAITTTGGVTYTIPHGLSYKPVAIAFMKSTLTGKRYTIPRFFPSIQQDPEGENNNGWIETDNTNVYIHTDDSSEVFYYLFLENQTG